MDAGITGGIIGVCIMVALGICFKIHDMCNQKQEVQRGLLTTPLLVRRHSKMNTLLPK
jgi:hypothetical protein